MSLEFLNPSFTHRGLNSLLWETEYNNYATCINTLSPRCYGAAHKPGLEVVDYFTRAAALFRTLDTYRALEKAGIVPDSGRHYALADVQRALERFTGGKVVLKCNGGGADILQEVRYVYFIKGSLQTGQFVPAQDLGREEEAGNCAPLVRYLPKRPKGEL
jgi:ribonuclease T2